MIFLVISDADENQRNWKDGFADNLWLESRDLGYRSTTVDANQHALGLNNIEQITYCETDIYIPGFVPYRIPRQLLHGVLTRTSARTHSFNKILVEFGELRSANDNCNW